MPVTIKKTPQMPLPVESCVAPIVITGYVGENPVPTEDCVLERPVPRTSPRRRCAGRTYAPLPFLLLLFLELGTAQGAVREELSLLEQLVVRGRCQARCNELYGHQERHLQIALFDHYLPYLCRADEDWNCTQCSKACLSEQFDTSFCHAQCDASEDQTSEACRSSCLFLLQAYEEEQSDLPGTPSVRARSLPRAAHNLALSRPSAACVYTDLTPSELSDRQPPPRSRVRLYWNVRDVTGLSTSLPLAFVVAVKHCRPAADGASDCSDPHDEWTYISKPTNFSVVPLLNLRPSAIYMFKVMAVHRSGFVPEAVTSDPITTPPSSSKLMPPVDLKVSPMYVRGGKLHAVVSWKAPPETGGCFFRLYSLPPQGSYEMKEVKHWGELKCELSKLTYGSLYSINVINADENFERFSAASNISLVTLDSCLKATGFDYNVCPPEKPGSLRLSSSLPYKSNDSSERELSDIFVSWDPPRHRRYRNSVSNYTLSFLKLPYMSNSDIVAPHRGVFFVRASATNFTIRECHWDGIYKVSLMANSLGGSSAENDASITLRNGYETDDEGNETEAENKAVLYAVAGPSSLALLAILVCLAYLWHLSSRKVKGHADLAHMEEINPIYECTAAKEEVHLLVADEYEIDPAALTFTRAIGEGAFGKVLLACLDFSVAHLGGRTSGTKTVAVKMLKEHATPDERRNLLLEIDAMKQLGQHHNIVSILACVTSGTRPCLVMHYCPLGDLRTYLRNNRKQAPSDVQARGGGGDSSTRSSCRYHSGDSGISNASKTSHVHRAPDTPRPLQPDREQSAAATEGAEDATLVHGFASVADNSESRLLTADQEKISQTKLLSFARQIAMGMEYLAERKFIHRDLATRNILLYSPRQLKISDFGLARDVYETSVYQPTSSRKLPYKWMALESIFDQIFTIKSDVWAFGIVLWEIVTLGGCPYPGIPNQDLFRLLREGYRMERPDNCSLEIYKMMLSCWHPRPEDRPTFTELRYTLESSLEKSQSYIDLTVTVSADYYLLESSEGSSSNSDLSSPMLMIDNSAYAGPFRYPVSANDGDDSDDDDGDDEEEEDDDGDGDDDDDDNSEGDNKDSCPFIAAPTPKSRKTSRFTTISSNNSSSSSNNNNSSGGGEGQGSSVRLRPEGGQLSVSAAADVHVCQMFHNNSSDRNLTLSLAQSLTTAAPGPDSRGDGEREGQVKDKEVGTSQAARQTPRDGLQGAHSPLPDARKGGRRLLACAEVSQLCAAGEEGARKQERTPQALPVEEKLAESTTVVLHGSLVRLSSSGGDTSSMKNATAVTSNNRNGTTGSDKNARNTLSQDTTVCRLQAAPPHVEERERSPQGEQPLGVVFQHGTVGPDVIALPGHTGQQHQIDASGPQSPTASTRLGSGSSSTELTCDCDSPDNLSDLSLSSGRSLSPSRQRVVVHHAPTLTYGILSLFSRQSGRDGEGGGGGRGEEDGARVKRNSRSLTDLRVEGLGLGGLAGREGCPAPGACSYDARTDSWACAL